MKVIFKIPSFKDFGGPEVKVNSEELWRSTLHDFNNLLAGLQGVLDLSDPRAPLEPRNRIRLEASIEDGKTLIAMARALALGRWPDLASVPWEEWRWGLEERLKPLSQLFRCPIEVVGDSSCEGERWPAPGLQDWIAAFTRQILPWVAPEPLRIEIRAAADRWVITWPGEAPMPAAFRPHPPADAPSTLPSYWLKGAADRLQVIVEETPQGLVAWVPRPCGC